VDLRVSEKIKLNNYLLPSLKYKTIESCFLIQQNQFIDCYQILGYLEATTLNSLEIVKFKVKNKDTKQILLISNEDCFKVKKEDFSTKKLNDFIINSNHVNETGKIIIENNNILTLQKGRPYFFPNCKNQDSIYKTNLQYRTISPNRIYSRFQTERKLSLNYYDTMKLSIQKKGNSKKLFKNLLSSKAEFSKLFLKRNGKLYSSLIPQFLKKFSVHNLTGKLKGQQIFRPEKLNEPNSGQISRTLLMQSSELVKNQYTNQTNSDYQLTLVKFIEHPFLKATKSIGVYAITEDYFEQDVNSVFCKNTEFVENGETLGLLKLEKEITGDIVQGLPRIEEILEARKKNLVVKRIPTSQKKGLLVQKSSLDPNFEFRKLGLTIKENEKINPHKLLKVYFNYYGLIKGFSCDRTETIKYTRLIKNYEGSYKSFKKVQSFILNSVQSVYQSQGVTINDKHLEVIIKQMTTKVLITYEGNTPLLRREVIDLYHIQYINQIVEVQGKKSAYYVPLLLGITKAALNNPSFISAASFQETTRVLTKAAMEGRIDWLRGLKENIIIGHLIPAGTGSQNYRNCFKKTSNFHSKIKPKIATVTNIL
jgi:sporulation protein YlmC with PRC-barrel domain